MRDFVESSVLVFRVGSLGDGLVAVPALKMIKQRYPGKMVRLLTNVPIASNGKAASMGAVLGELGLVDDCLSYHLGGWRDALKIRSSLKASGVRRFFYLMPERSFFSVVRDYIFFRFLVGLSFENGIRNISISRRCRSGEAEAQRLVRLAFGTSVSFDECVKLASLDSVPSGVFIEGRYICFSVGTKNLVCDWGQDKWKHFIGELFSRFSSHCLVAVGVQSESDRSEALLNEWGGPVANMCGRLSVSETHSLLSKADVFVGHDSGPVHLAAAARCPVVCVSAARSEKGKWVPLAEKFILLRRDIECQGCGYEHACPQSKRCIESIAVAEVLEAVTQLVNQVRENV